MESQSWTQLSDQTHTHTHIIPKKKFGVGIRVHVSEIIKRLMLGVGGRYIYIKVYIYEPFSFLVELTTCVSH